VKLFEILDTPKSLYLIVEYADGGDLYTYLERQGINGRFDETRARRYFGQIVQVIFSGRRFKIFVTW
jgi:serine/threonine protein kinase